MKLFTLMKQDTKGRTRGFTLVELVITISIIAILTTIVTFGFLSVQKTTNDKEREIDVVAISNALDKYYDKHGEYPANDDLNPTASPTKLPNFDTVKSLMPELKDDDLVGPRGSEFYAGCINSGTCTNTSAYWETYHTKQYYYLSRFTSSQSPGSYYYANVPSWYGNDNGWGCTIKTYYTNPGFVIVYRNEADNLWIFKRSKHGNIDIYNYDDGPVAPQTCTFTYG